MTEQRKAGGFADLHVHSHYSYRDGVSSIEELVETAVALGRPAMALTDHGHAAGWVEFQEAADKLGLVNPIFGVDIDIDWSDSEESLLQTGRSTWAAESCGGESERLAQGEKGSCSHNLVLLARNETGLQNLFKLLSWAGTNGYDRFDGSPRLIEEILLAHTDGLAVLSGGPCGQISRLLAAEKTAEASAVARRYREAFGENFYLELVGQASAVAQADCKRLVAFGKEHKLPLLATTNVHYSRPEQAKARDLLWAIADNIRLKDQIRRSAGDDAYPLPLAELERRFAEIPEALQNAANLAENCRARLPKSSLIIPDLAVPAEFAELAELSELSGSASNDNRSAAGLYLEKICRDTLGQRYGNPLPAAMETRLNYELGVIEKAGFPRYILIVADIVNEARQQAILCAPRGSSAGSLVCYACGITPLNPLDYGLLFERFLNEARIAPPDIDLDIADEARPRLLDYVVKKYGAENVAHITTHNFEGAKSALRDAGKALDSDPILVNKLVGLVPIEFQKPYTLTRTLEEEPETRRLYKSDPKVTTLYDHALLIEGTGRNFGTHAAGVVITPRPIAEYAPLIRTEGLAQNQRNAQTENAAPLSLINVMTQWDMESVEKRGLLKMDLLGLTAWSAIGHALAFIKQQKNLDLNIWELPQETAVYQTLAQGYTLGVFQLENQGMTEFCIGMKPQSIQDLALMIAAYRPGPMPFLQKLLNVRHGREKLKTPHLTLEPIMAETYGVPVYQETMLKIAQEVAGYSLGEADVLRKAIGKKNQKELIAQQQKFTGGALARSFSAKVIEEIWEMFPPFAFYGFNQAHAIIYGYLTYITAYLKVKFPLEYLGALLTVAGGDTNSVVKAVSECRRLHVPLLGPDVNQSGGRLSLGQTPEGQPALRLGLAAIKGLGPAGVEAIQTARRDGEFQGLADFIRRVPGRAVNSRALTALIRVGAFPFASRASLEAGLAAAQKAAKAKNFAEPALLEEPEHELETLLTYESELLGFHLTPLPVTETVAKLEAAGRVNATTLEVSDGSGQPVRIGGAITGGREVQSRFGVMYVFNLNDGRGLLEVNVYPKVYRERRDLLKEGKLIVVEGKADQHEGRARLTAAKIEAANAD